MRLRPLPRVATIACLAWAMTVPGRPASAQVAPDTVGPRPDPTFTDDLVLGTRLVGHGLAAPLRWTTEQWLNIPTVIVVLGAISPADRWVMRQARASHGDVADVFFDAVEPLGMEYSFLVVAGVYAGGWVLEEPGVRRTAVEAAAASLLAGGVATPILKAAFGRARPRDGRGVYRFDPLSRNWSFPSGHTTQAFAVASVIAAESPHAAVDALAYGLATAVGVSRIYHDAHFFTDVVAGALIGTVVGRTVAREGRDRRPPVAPLLDILGGGEPAVGVSVRF